MDGWVVRADIQNIAPSAAEMRPCAHSCLLPSLCARHQTRQGRQDLWNYRLRGKGENWPRNTDWCSELQKVA